MRHLCLRSRQCGQALVETITISLALLPMFIAIPLLAKYADIRRAAIDASRAVAFDCTVRFDDCDAQAQHLASLAEIRRSHFGDPAYASTSLDAVAATALQPNRFWVDRQHAALLDPSADLQIGVSRERSDAIAGAFGNGAGKSGIGAASKLAGPDSFGLPLDGGLIRAEVAARVSIGKTFAQWMQRPEGLELRLAGSTAILTDAWNASEGDGSDPRSVRSRVDEGWAWSGIDAVVDLAYTPIRELITGPLLAPFEPRGKLFRYHEVDVELVPPDRLEEPK